MSWSLDRAEEHLLSLELFGMRFGLERMRRLLTALGSPQATFRAVHVVGTNGKSSTTRFAAAMLEAHGVRAGAYLSPHLRSFAERIRIGDRDLPADEFGAVVERVAAAARKVERGLDEGDRITQFELLTAAAFCALAEGGVEVAAIEAGLGGRWDATNVLDAPVVVLTNVGLEHTRWLGPTVADIAAEKLAVVRPGAVLVLGDRQAEVGALAAATGAEVRPVGEELDVALPRYQRRNAALAAEAVRATLGSVDEALLRSAASAVAVPGRFQRVAEEPLTIIDGAHNPAGMEALVEALPDAVGSRPLVACVSILDDKDAAGMLRALLPLCSALVCTTSANPRSLPPATLGSLAGQL
ncbi:MAG: dihydrofolate synthase / folylpolyglutamate synthase, partial [Solirubrobacteraceae bacterium]|nr:dihydrofolate synthase / folylpolyglutamate synthase [Solirubrobacteraceae bacterium]